MSGEKEVFRFCYILWFPLKILKVYIHHLLKMVYSLVPSLGPCLIKKFIEGRVDCNDRPPYWVGVNVKRKFLRIS